MYDVMEGIKVVEVAEHTFVPASAMILADRVVSIRLKSVWTRRTASRTPTMICCRTLTREASAFLASSCRLL